MATQNIDKLLASLLSDPQPYFELDVLSDPRPYVSELDILLRNTPGHAYEAQAGVIEHSVDWKLASQKDRSLYEAAQKAGREGNEDCFNALFSVSSQEAKSKLSLWLHYILGTAAAHGHSSIVVSVLDQLGSNVDSSSIEFATQRAAANGHIPVLKFLLTKLDAFRGQAAASALREAAKSDQRDAVKFFVEEGLVDPGTALDIAMEEKMTCVDRTLAEACLNEPEQGSLPFPDHPFFGLD